MLDLLVNKTITLRVNERKKTYRVLGAARHNVLELDFWHVDVVVEPFPYELSKPCPSKGCYASL